MEANSVWMSSFLVSFWGEGDVGLEGREGGPLKG